MALEKESLSPQDRRNLREGIQDLVFNALVPPSRAGVINLILSLADGDGANIADDERLPKITDTVDQSEAHKVVEKACEKLETLLADQVFNQIPNDTLGSDDLHWKNTIGDINLVAHKERPEEPPYQYDVIITGICLCIIIEPKKRLISFNKLWGNIELKFQTTDTTPSQLWQWMESHFSSAAKAVTWNAENTN